MKLATVSVRSIAFAAALLAGSVSAHALTIGTASLVANSVQAFSQEALDQFAVINLTVTPLGNATALATEGAFNMPITSITVDSKLHVSGGAAKGSALELSRTLAAGTYKITLANFQIDYVGKKVIADVQKKGPTYETVNQSGKEIYSFNVATPLALKYKFPLSITGHEVLDQLFLTEDAQADMMTGLRLPAFIAALLPVTDFGSLTQDIKVAFRKKVSDKAYVPAP